ncbi:MAG: hypothetical protein WA160_09305 [Pseudobdellovibrio sp.]
MRRYVVVASASIFMLIGSLAHAGKVEDVQGAMKKDCQKDVSSADALRMVKDLFLSCTSGSKIAIEGCQVTCLKENAGAVVGK